jgi:mannitol/fructose-specific phosphotransferase system IIA component
VGEHQPKALSSNPSTTNRKKKKIIAKKLFFCIFPVVYNEHAGLLKSEYISAIFKKEKASLSTCLGYFFIF